MKKTIAVVFGGKSVEHDISVITGLQVLRNIDTKYYNIFPIYITKSGVFVTAKNLDDIDIYKDYKKLVKGESNLSFVLGKPYIAIKKGRCYKSNILIHCAVLCLHGMNGEDGSVAGLFELCGIPHTGSGVLSSAITMDKVFMKDIMVANGIPTVKYASVLRTDFLVSPADNIKSITDKLSFPMIVKPSNLGSSIGIKTCSNIEELEDAISVASNFDDRILIEEFIEGATEYNCAGVGTTVDVVLSNIEKPLKTEKILSFNDKYIEKKSGKDNNIGIRLTKEIKELTRLVYKIFYCSGVVRIDYLYDKENKKLYVNELNAIPGSLAFYLFSPASFTVLIDELIGNAMLEYQNKLKNKYSFDSSAIDLFSKQVDLCKYLK